MMKKKHHGPRLYRGPRFSTGCGLGLYWCDHYGKAAHQVSYRRGDKKREKEAERQMNIFAVWNVAHLGPGAREEVGENILKI